MQEINGINFSKTSRFKSETKIWHTTGNVRNKRVLVLATAEEVAKSRVIFPKRTSC
jgi:hypothetical protein